MLHIPASALSPGFQVRDLSHQALPKRKVLRPAQLRIAEHRSDVMSSGTVKWFNAQKGYGFIQPDGGSKDVFVHISAVEQAGLRGLKRAERPMRRWRFREVNNHGSR
jgi:cold shock CspA family protein